MGGLPVVGSMLGGKGATEGLMSMASEAFAMGKPAMQAGLGMFTDAVNTGQGPDIRQPVYSQAAEKSLQASNQTQAGMADDFARTGMAGTPFAEAMLKQVDQQGRQNAYTAPAQMENEDYWKILSTFFPASGQLMGMGTQGMGTAGGLENQQMQQLMQLGMSFNPMSK